METILTNGAICSMCTRFPQVLDVNNYMTFPTKVICIHLHAIFASNVMS